MPLRHGFERRRSPAWQQGRKRMPVRYSTLTRSSIWMPAGYARSPSADRIFRFARDVGQRWVAMHERVV